jgi:solute carrier family 25 oxoglutarate transporter 11
MTSMNGPKQGPNTISSSRKYSGYQTSGLNLPKSKYNLNLFYLYIYVFSFNRTTFGLIAGGGDTAIKLAMWQYCWGGTWSPQEFSDSNSFKHLIAAIAAVTPTAALTVPFENARRAYFADKTWPLELRKGYTSPTNALLRIPFEEGPYYLFKGGLPHIASQWVFWVGYFTMYSWMKNKVFFMWLYNEFSYDYIKLWTAGSSFFLASFIAYPLLFVREMVDIWPKERGGHCTWNNDYRTCMRWMFENMDTHFYNFLSGYWGWVRRYGAQYFIALWVADSMGMFSNNNEAYNSLEIIFPTSVEYI